MDLFRRALGSEIPLNRISAAAALAIIDQPWSRSELASVLEECNDQVMTAECRSALLQTHSQECHRTVMEWESRNPHEPEYGDWMTMDEMAITSIFVVEDTKALGVVHIHDILRSGIA